jgi:glycosyltransferase involved in cell wall biosynthesis
MPDIPSYRVLFVCGGKYVYGKEVVTQSQAQGLSDLGHKVTVAASCWSDGDFVSRLSEAGLRFRTLCLGFISKTWRRDAVQMTIQQGVNLPQLWWQYGRLLEEERPEVVFHTEFHHLCVLLPWLQRRDWMIVHEVFPAIPFYSRVFGLLARRLGGFVAVSHFVGESLRALGIREAQIAVVPNGVGLPTAETVKAERRAHRSRPTSELVLGLVGQIAPWKGHLDALAALALVNKVRPATLWIYGAATNGFIHEAKGCAERLGMADKVVWCGYEPKAEKIYPGLDVLLVPSCYEEPFGLVALEAAGWRVPAVVTNSGELPKLVRDGKTGLIVPKSNPAALAMAILHLASDNAYGEWGMRSRENALEFFSLEKMRLRLNSLLPLLVQNDATTI